MQISTYVSRTALAAALGLGLGLTAPSVTLAQGSKDTTVERGEGKQHWHGKRGKRGCRGKRGKGMYRALAKLDLTANQQAQVDAIKETAREQKRELRSQDGSREKRAQYRSIKRETRALILDVLTPEQREELEEIRAARKAEKLDRKVRWMTRRLDLTSAQQEQVRAALESSQARRQDIREKVEDREDRREAMRAVRSETREAIRGALTPEQAQKLDEMKQKRRGKRGWRGKHGKRGRR